jgi:molybdenum cofactor synthesis domain-containing protein
LKAFHELVTPLKARKILVEEIKKIEHPERKNIQDATFLICSEDVFSKEDVPPFDRSEVDGYAVNHKSVEGAEEDSPVTLDIVGEIEIGKKPGIEVAEGGAAYISTGSIIPRGADAVVMVEYTSRDGDRVNIYRSVSPGENIAHTGSDFFRGEVLARKGSIIRPETIALLASSGIDKVGTMRKLMIGIFSTGNEIIEPGSILGEGMIYDSNSYYFKSALDATGLVSCELLGILRDDEKTMARSIRKWAGIYDILISSGSTSAGFHDMLYRVIENVGGELKFHGIAIKPGKPTFLASLGPSILIGMPGFPLSSASVMKYVVIPSIKEAYGIGEKEEKRIRLAFRINAERGKETVLPAIIGRSGRAYPIFGESGSISRLYYADGLIILSSRRNFYERDQSVRFFRLENKEREMLFIGSNDPLIERILYDSARSPTLINAGSWGGVEAIRIGEADVAGIHLLKDGIYNTFIMDGDLAKHSVLLRGFSRVQGIVSREGVSSFSEIYRKNLLFVNRNKGSGTRDLIDSEIERELGKFFHKEDIRGYLWEAKSHAAVAKSVVQGRADAGVSIQFYSMALGLKFHKIRDEDYDILIRKEVMNSPVGRRFISKLKNSASYASEFPGYIFPDNMGELIG